VTRLGRRDAANLMVLESIVIALLILGAMMYVTAFNQSTESAPGGRHVLESAAEDSLAVLSGLTTSEDAYNRNMLTKLVVEALYGQSANLTHKLDNFLPKGARYNVWLDNGYAPRLVVGDGVSSGERVSAGIPYQPAWSVAFVAADFAVYSDTSTKMNATVLPVLAGNAVAYGADWPHPHLKYANGVKVTPLNDTQIPSERHSYVGPGAGGYPTSGALVLQSDDAFPHGSTALRGKATWSIRADSYLDTSWGASRAALNTSRLDIARWDEPTGAYVPGRVVPVGGTARLTWDFSDYVAVHANRFAQGSTNTTAIRILAPIPMLNTTNGLYYVAYAKTFDGTSGAWDLDIPKSALLGPHLVVAELNHTLAGSTGPVAQSARLHERLDVALEGGVVPINPVYRLVIEAWHPEWE